MKKKQFSKKLKLNKERISNLESAGIKGGLKTPTGMGGTCNCPIGTEDCPLLTDGC